MKSQILTSHKTYILSTLIIALSRNFRMARAGEHRSHSSMPDFEQIKDMIAKLSEELSLSGEQKTQISTIGTTHFEEVKQRIKSGETNQNEIGVIRNEFEDEESPALTIQQQKLLVAFTVTPVDSRNVLKWTISGIQGIDWSITSGALDQASVTLIWKKPGTYIMIFTETESQDECDDCLTTRNFKVRVNDNFDVVIEDAIANGTTDVTFGQTKQMVQTIGHSIILQQFLLLQ